MSVHAQNFYKRFFGKKDSTQCQEVDHADGGWIYLPIVYYTPDTRFGFGGLVGRYFHLTASPEDTLTRLSYVKLFSTYTLNRQIDIWNSFNIFFPNETWMMKGEFRFKHFPDSYYGIGNSLLQRTEQTLRKERYEYNQFTFNIAGFRRIYPQMFIGLNYELNTYINLQSLGGDPNRELPLEILDGLVNGSSGGTTSGIGISWSWDKRENLFNSRTGMLFEVQSTFFGKFIGSSYDYQNYKITYNKYYPIKRKAAFAFQFVGNFNRGTPPFFRLAPVGGDNILRGYAQNLYRDQNMLGSQAEIRFPLWWRFGGVSFVGIGDIFDSSRDLSFNRIKYSFGTGLRFTLDEHENVNLRLDFGFGRQSSGFYFSIGEAF